MFEYERYLGKPWESGASGDDAYDCWGLFRAVRRDIFKEDVADIVFEERPSIKEVIKAYQDHPVRQLLKPITLEGAKTGDLVFLRKGLYACHCGVLIKDDYRNYLLHSVEETGVCCQLLRDVKKFGFQIEGFYKIEFAAGTDNK